MELYHILTIFAVLILACACSSKLSSWINMPVLVVFLGVGMLAGSQGIGKIPFDDPNVANWIGSAAMAFILFSGGFDTKWSSVKRIAGYGGILSSIGVLLTALFVGVFSHLYISWQHPDMNIPLSWCLLLGAIVSSTDAAAVFSRERGVVLFAANERSGMDAVVARKSEFDEVAFEFAHGGRNRDVLVMEQEADDVIARRRDACVETP